MLTRITDLSFDKFQHNMNTSTVKCMTRNKYEANETQTIMIHDHTFYPVMHEI